MNNNDVRIMLRNKYPQLNEAMINVVIKKASQQKKKGQLGKGFFDKLTNAVIKSYNLVRGKKEPPQNHFLKDGERHAILKDKQTGALAGAKFCGPNTRITENLQELLDNNEGNISLALADKNFISKVDKVCTKHDLSYALADRDPEKIRQADNKMLERIRELHKEGESLVNTAPSYLGIASKVKLEDLGILSPEQFASSAVSDLTPEEKDLYEKTYQHLEMQGYGKKRPTRSRGSSWMDHVKQYSKDNKVSFKVAMKEAKSSYKPPQKAKGKVICNPKIIKLRRKGMVGGCQDDKEEIERLKKEIELLKQK